MIAVRGLFHGRRIKLSKELNVKKPQEAIITFSGNSENKTLYQGMYRLAETGGSFDFLNAPEEDIYSDGNLKVKYKWE